MLVGKIYDETSYLVSMKLIRRREYRTVKLSPKAYTVTIQLQYDELTCYMFANKIQAGAISSHVHDFLDTFCARYYGSSILPSPQYYELLMKKGVKSALEGSLEILHPFLQLHQISEFRAPCCFGKCSPYWLPLLLQPQCAGVGRLGMGINADSSSLTGSTLF